MKIFGPNPVTGPDAQASWLNRVWQAIAQNRLLPGQGYRLIQRPTGTILQIDPQGGAGRTPNLTLRLVSVEDDFLNCNTWDGTTQGTSVIYVAKPYKLRCSLKSVVELGITYNFTYNPGGDSNNKIRIKAPVGGSGNAEQELVTPIWTVNDEITAVPVLTTVKTLDDNPIKLIMVSDSRQWAVQQ